MELIDKVLAALSLLAFLVWWAFMAPTGLKNFVNNVTLHITIAFFDLLELIRKVVALATLTLYFVGRLGTLGVLSLSLFIVVCEALRIYGYQPFSSEPIYQEWLSLFGKPYSWAAITAIVASTVAINHVLKYELELEKYLQEQKERFQEKVKS